VMNKGDLNGWKGIMNIDCPNDGYGWFDYVTGFYVVGGEPFDCNKERFG
jgi:hypothetical protein